MAETGGFKHIAVTSDVDDDVVIHAGVKRPLDEGLAAADAAKSLEGEANATSSQPMQQPSQPVESSQPNEAAPMRSEEHDESAASRTAKGSAVVHDGYRETTLDDLKSAPMSSMQKGIIVFAVLAIAVAVVYYMMFMR